MPQDIDVKVTYETKWELEGINTWRLYDLVISFHYPSTDIVFASGQSTRPWWVNRASPDDMVKEILDKIYSMQR